MADWSMMEHEWPNQFDPYQYGCNAYYQEKPPVEYVSPQAHSIVSPPSPTMALLRLNSPEQVAATPQAAASREPPVKYAQPPPAPKGDTPREIRNRAEKQRRDKLNQSIALLASIVPPVVAASRKIDKTGILRFTAHFLRSHNYVFGDSINQTQDISPTAAQTLLNLMNGFLITCTYKGLIVVASQNVQQFLGFTELELLGHNIFNFIHEEDRQMMREQLLPKPHLLGSNGELLIPDGPDGMQKVADALIREKRRFIVRFKKPSQRSEPCQYVTCHVEGSLRKSDRACRGYNRCCQMVRRARARGENPCSSGNDIVFVGLVRPVTETFLTETGLESFRMEYRTRHSIDGQIIQSEHRIALVTGYMTNEVCGVNAMNFMHRDDVRWVIIALREMYDQHRLAGESCYRLMTKNGQFIYMRTRGCLDVDPNTRAVTSFVCTNTVVDEQEGKHLIKLMKKKFAMIVNQSEEIPQEEESREAADNQTLKVEDPRRLKKVILHLVTDLPAKTTVPAARNKTPEQGSSSPNLAIIPPKKEKIVSAIEKIYSVIATLPKNRVTSLMDEQRNALSESNNKSIKAEKHDATINISPQASSSATADALDSYVINGVTLPAYDDVYPQCSRDNTSIPKLVSREPAETVTSGYYTGPNVFTLEAFDTGSESNDLVHNIHQPANIEYDFNLSDLENDNDGDVIQSEMGDSQSSTAPTGVKRSGNFQDQGIAYKKKIGEIPEDNAAVEEIINQERALDQAMALDRQIAFDQQIAIDQQIALGQQIAANNDDGFDNNLYDMPSVQIDNALNSLDVTITDPSFPDFLTSPDGQEIIKQINSESSDGYPVT